jgi:hypothetical protein
MSLIKKIGNFDSKLFIDAFEKIKNEIQWTDSPHGSQAGVQYKEGEDVWSSAVGKLKKTESDYFNLNPAFKNTIFEEVIAEHSLFRSRLMWVKPFSCYSFHNDASPRIHFPLITNEECFFMFKHGDIQHLSVDNVWLVDTRFKHSFLNTSKIPRLHFVGVISNKFDR